MVVAIVNGYKIKAKEYFAELKCVLKKVQLHEANKEAKFRAIDQLIDGYLLLQQAKQENLSINTQEIDNKMIDLMMKYRSEKEFKDMLFQKNLDVDKIREKVANDLLIEKFFQKHFPPTNEIPMQKLKEVYQENLQSFHTTDLVRVSHILIKGHAEEAFRRIQEIRSNITNKDDFCMQAECFSECPSCCSCGDLGFVTKGSMQKEFEEAIFNLTVGEISKPIKTEFGYHLIMITDKKSRKLACFEEVKDALKKRLQQIDCELKLIQFLKKIRTDATIKIYEELL